MDAKEAFVALNMMEHLGPIRVRLLLDQFGDAPSILKAPTGLLRRVPGLGDAAVQSLVRWEKEVDLSAEMARIQAFGCRIVTQADDEYPALLKQIYDPPVVLYVKGPIAARPGIALVGTRQATPYGREVARRLARQLSAAGLTTVSGGARGVDTAAHHGALSVGGATVAVLGTGINQVFPPENSELFSRLASEGALVTQFPFNRPADRQSFPIRNRIVAGMTLGTIVVEANQTSGALITADFACEYGRQVFAVPGRIDSPRSRGCHDLLRKGAALCESVDDVLRELEFLLPSHQRHEAKRDLSEEREVENPATQPTGLELSAEEQALYDAIPEGAPVHLDHLVRHYGDQASSLLGTLLRLEMKRVIRQRPGRWFERRV